MKNLHKILIIIVIVFLTMTSIIIGTGYFFIKNSWSKFLTEQEVEQLVEYIETSEDLPHNVTDLFEKIYPGLYENYLNKAFIKSIYSSNQILCPCRLAANNLPIDFTKAYKAVRHYYPATITWKIEEKTTQRKCFDFFLQSFDFTDNIIGVGQAAKIYFDKELEDLTEDEILEIILRTKNSSLYNKRKFPDLFEEELNKLKREINVSS